MHPAEVRVLWRAVAAVGLLVMFPLFFVGGPAYQSPRSLCQMWNLGHIVFFALGTMLVWDHFLARGHSLRSSACVCLLLSILLGISIEIVQLGIGNRSIGWGDVARDLCGTAIFLCWRLGVDTDKVGLRRLYHCLAVVIVVACLFPLVLVLVDELLAKRDFPLLAGFEQSLEIGRWSGSERIWRVEEPVRKGRYAAQINLPARKYSGVSLFHVPEDWRGMQALAFSVFNPGAPVTLHFRVHDRQHSGKRQQYHNRYNGTRVLARGWNDIAIPMNAIYHAPVGRNMDLAHIRGFGLFIMDQPERILYLDDVHLVREKKP
jgi:hypothetical protein